MTTDFEVDTEEENVFDLVVKRRTELNKKENKNTIVSNNNREDIPWYGLENDQETVLRFLGSLSKREENWYPKTIFHAELLTDTKKRFSDIIWKTQVSPMDKDIPVLDNSWILKRLYDTVYTKFYDKTPFIDSKGIPRKGKYVYTNEHLSCYKLLQSNELDITSNVKIFPKKFKPNKRVLMPVLVRNEGSTQVKVLTTKHVVKEYTDYQGNKRTQVYCDFGIPISEDGKNIYLYDQITNFFSKAYGYDYSHWDFDVVIKKTKLTDIQIAYSINACFSDSVSPLAKSYVTTFPEFYEVNTLGKNNKVVKVRKPHPIPLTKEEQALEKPNLDELFKTTSYKKLYTYHKELFKLVDTELRTNFYDELVSFYEKESPEDSHLITAEKFAVNVKEKVVNTLPNTPVSSLPISNTQSQNGVVDTSKRHSLQEDSVSSLEDMCKKIYPFWDKTSKEDKELVLSTIDSFEDNVPKFKSEFFKNNKILKCNCERKYLKSDGTPSEKSVCFHQDIKDCLVCDDKLE